MSSKLPNDYDTIDNRVEALNALPLPDTAIERFLKSRGRRVPTKNKHFYTNVSEVLSEGEFKSLIFQHKYAGRQTINYFIIKGISNYTFNEIEEDVETRLPKKDEVENVVKEPFLAYSERFQTGETERLYLAIGYKESAGSENPITGQKEGILISKRVVVVIQEDSDLVEVRGSDDRMVTKIRDEVCKSIGKFKDSVKREPNLGPQFQDEFNELVELYYNLKVRVDDQEDSTLDAISFTSKEDATGQRKDARADSRVEEELSERGGEITMGYVELSEGFKFNLNREKSKISFQKSEREENINQVTDLIDNVLKQAGEYSQEQITGTEDVPE